MKNEIKEWIIDLIGVVCAAAVFALLFTAFLYALRSADSDMPGRAEVSAEVFGAGAPVEEAEFVTDIYVGHIEIYREGDGEPPAWYRPSEPMAAEWTADVTDIYVGNKPEYILDVPLDAELQAYIWTLCEEAGVPYTLVIAVIEAESTYRADVISATHDYGLMQVNIICHDWLRGELGIEDFLDPRENVLAGVYVLGQYYRQYGYASGALVAYNQGQASAEAMFSTGVYETDYSRRVMEIQRRLEAEGR